MCFLMKSITLDAFAKINLGLDIVGKREDGYHLVKMIMQTVGLADQLTIKKGAASEAITLTTNRSDLPTNQDNLIYQAAKQLKEEFHISDSLFIHLEKQIPVAAGMAGGSADCAATLLGINDLFGLGLSQEDLMKRGVTFGADVPYCILKGTALSEGIGEILTPLPPIPQCQVLLIKPTIAVSTKWVYQTLQWDKLQKHPDIEGMQKALQRQDLSSVITRLGNVLETVTIPQYPVIDEIKEKMLAFGADNALMSGSGPTVFGLFTNSQKAEQAYGALQSFYRDYQVVLTNFFNVK